MTGPVTRPSVLLMSTETYTTRRVSEITPDLAIEAGLRGIELTTAGWAPAYTSEGAPVQRRSEHVTITEKLEPKPELIKAGIESVRTGYEHWTSSRISAQLDTEKSIDTFVRLATEGLKRGLTIPAPPKPELKAERPARKAPAADLTEGTYKTEWATIVRVTRSREGRLYGKIWEGTTFEYRPGLLKGLTSDMLMTLDEAMAFGKQFGTCCMCARRLTNPESIDKGIGPICEKGF